MKKRFLIINCSSPYFLYIPMGSFGLCDFLEKRGIVSRIFNPALYRQHQVRELLLEKLSEYEPTHIGLIFHWQETAHGMLDALETIRSRCSQTPVICGGFTAGYFGRDLMKSCPGIDYIIQGDPEEPVSQLLEGAPPSTIPNLIHRQHGTIVTNPESWLIDKATLDELSFANLDLLFDSTLYLSKINKKLGFPVFIGRGCVFNCEYCGGSRYAFTSHSNRVKTVSRSMETVLKDLHRLKRFTDTLYICYENDIQYITKLFQAITQDPVLKGHFKLNYGAWHLLSPEFLRLYKEAFQLSDSGKAVIEFSPEIYSDTSRSAVKGGSTYSIDALIDNIGFTNEMLEGKVLTDIFFSRYHPTETTAEEVYQEIFNIFYLKHKVWKRYQHAAHVSYDHLSTDVGSRYWQHHVDQPFLFNTLLNKKEKLDAQSLYPFPVDNLCFYIPMSIKPQQQLAIEGFVQLLEGIERNCFELYHILSACLSTDWFQTLRSLVDIYIVKDPSFFFRELPLEHILQSLGEQLAGNSAVKNMPFLRDLVRFSIKKVQQSKHDPEPYLRKENSDFFVLNREAISIHEHDYPDLRNFIHRIEESGKKLEYQRTACLYMSTSVITLPHSYYRNTLKKFTRPMQLGSYLDTLTGQAAYGDIQHRQLIEQLIDNGILLASPPPG